ncbi:exonuclease domain-containing protein [Xanthobacter sp. TB0139]|uniref:exonuclease domain-containing protein n=1 Tax=Xanthobacter sp. TB0139 TaxID=3459178 RepID=UPI00403907EF
MSRPGFDKGRILAIAVPGIVLGLWLVLGAVLGWVMLVPGQKKEMLEAVEPIMESHGGLVFAWWLVLACVGAWVVARFHESHVSTPARLADATRAMSEDAAAPDLPDHSGAVGELARAINALAARRRDLAKDMERLVEEASRNVAHQRDQLAALMAELEQSVVVCNLEGRILLYNARARALFRRVLQEEGEAGGTPASAAIGLGRSIHTLIEPAYLDHARAEVERHLARHEMPASARFVITTPAGHLLQVSMAPVRPADTEDMADAGEATEMQALSGFVLLLDDITEEYEADARRDRHLLELTEASRASFANMQAALDMLDYPDLDVADRERFLAIVRDEVRAMSARLSVLAADVGQELKTRWPLQNMPGIDLVTLVAERIQTRLHKPVAMEEVDAGLWLSVDSFAVVESLAFLAEQLVEEQADLKLLLRLSAAGGRAHLDLAWRRGGQGGALLEAALPVEKLTAWQNMPMAAQGEGHMSARDVAERHGGELWLEHDGARHLAFFRFLLPQATGAAVDLLSPADSRPEYYDFGLLSARAGNRELEERELGELSYTVFDTETTGLDPRGGDEILQIGATRIVNGKILRGECFDQLVDPQRSIPEAGIAVHGVTPAMVRGQPAIGEVLPRFRAWVSDTVLVGHNVAFDMRFLKLKEEATGIFFDLPVLDTLLLASIVWPNEEAHGLEALAGRLGIQVSDRHRALGDALVTAEVFLKLLPLLAQRDIHTLSQARKAAEESYYARLNY